MRPRWASFLECARCVRALRGGGSRKQNARCRGQGARACVVHLSPYMPTQLSCRCGLLQVKELLSKALCCTDVGTRLLFENKLCRVWDFYLEPDATSEVDDGTVHHHCQWGMPVTHMHRYTHPHMHSPHLDLHALVVLAYTASNLVRRSYCIPRP